MGKRYNMVVCGHLDVSYIPITCITTIDLVFGVVSRTVVSYFQNFLESITLNERICQT